MHVYYFLGGCLVAWALLVSFLGIVKEGFPASKGTERLVALVSVILALATISAAAIGGAHEKKKTNASGSAALPGR